MKRRDLTVGAILLIVAIVPIRDVLLNVPAYHHDWIWPLYRPSFGAVAGFGNSAWLPIDLGAPNLYPSLLPLLLVEAILLQLLSPALALSALLTVLYASGSCGIYVFCRRLQCSTAAALVAAAAYVLSPALFSQLVAGHLGDVVMYAAFPWLMAALFERVQSVAMLLRCGLFAALMSVQVQGIALSVGAAVLCAAILRGSWRWLCVGAVCLAIVTTNANTFWGLLGPQRSQTQYIAQEHAVLSWVDTHSARFLDASSGRGYFAQYDRARFPLARLPFFDALPILGMLYLVAVSRGQRLREVLVLAVLFLLGAIVCSGLKGPAGGLFAQAFVRIEATSLFRELEHAAIFVAFPIAVGFAALLDGARRIRRVTPRNAAAFAVCLVALAIWADPAIAGTAAFLPHATQSADDASIVRALARAPGADHFAIFPGRQPYRADHGIGVDPASYYRVGEHVPIFAYFPQSASAYAGDHWYAGDTAAAFSMYARMGVNRVFYRPAPSPAPFEQIPAGDVAQLHLHANTGRRISRLTMGTTGAQELSVSGIPLATGGDFDVLARIPQNRVAVFLRQQPHFLSDGHLYRLLAADDIDLKLGGGCVTAVRPRPSYVYSDPREGWVDGTRFGIAMTRLDDALDGSVFTTGGPALPPEIRRARWVLATDGQRPYAWVSPQALRSRAAAIALAVLPGETPCALPRGSAHDVVALRLTGATRNSSSRWSGTFVSSGAPGTLYLAETFDEGWLLQIDGTQVAARQHFKGNGFANAWVFDSTPGAHRFEVRYAPEVRFGALLIVQLLAWAALAATSVVLRNV